MAAFKGTMLLLKIGDGGVAEAFSTVGGLRVTRLAVNRQVVAVQDMTNEGWREIREQAGIASVRLQGQGIFTDSAEEGVLRGQALSGEGRNYRLFFGNGDCLAGRFVIGSYERGGTVDGVESVALSLESSGPVTYIAA